MMTGCEPRRRWKIVESNLSDGSLVYAVQSADGQVELNCISKAGAEALLNSLLTNCMD